MLSPSDFAIRNLALRRAFERRFGQSLLELRISNTSEGLARVYDPETGSWAEYEWRGRKRIRRVRDFDAMARQ